MREEVIIIPDVDNALSLQTEEERIAGIFVVTDASVGKR